jgi:putative endonuclease
MYYVYILWSDTRHYIWITEDIARRLEEHQNGKNKSTKSYSNIFLIGYFIKETRSEAHRLEKMIKKNGHINHWIDHSTFIKT